MKGAVRHGATFAEKLSATCATTLQGIVGVLLVLTLAACGGGGGTLPPIPQQWSPIANPNRAGIAPTLNVCGSALAALGFIPLGTGLAQTSVDHGATWQDSPLAGGIRELGDSGYYWRHTDFFLPTATDYETRDCGMTWMPIGPTLKACLGTTATALWRTGVSNRKLFAQGTIPASGKHSTCASTDDGQTWSQGPVLFPGITPVVAVRGSRWFAIILPGGALPGASRLLFSDDDGQTWEAGGLESAGHGLELIASTSHAPRQIFVALDTGSIFGSQDSGNSWADTSYGLPGGMSNTLVFDPTLANRLYAASTTFWAMDVSK